MMTSKLSSGVLLACIAAVFALSVVPSDAFSPPSSAGAAAVRRLTALAASSSQEEQNDASPATAASTDRRIFLSYGAAALLSASFVRPALADDGESIASRAARLSKFVDEDQKKALEEAELVSPTSVQPSTSANADTRTMYDFELPVQGLPRTMRELIGRGGKDGDSAKQPKVVLFVNMKQDDVVARKNIPELIALASRFGREGDFAVVCSPTDQGYYE